jgi:hypothetical protein
MARIFNTIRQRLLKENRLTRYLIYAIGEIVLVVVGILIALQINTWNEHRKHTKMQLQQLDVLMLDLNAKREENIADLEFGERMISSAEEALADISAGRLVDTANVRTIIEYIGMDAGYYNTTTPTFNSVVNSDLWQQLPDTLAQNIQDIYDHRFSRINKGFEKLSTYATDCRLTYLTPNDLVDTDQPPLVLSLKIAEDPEAFRLRLKLFISGGSRLNMDFAGSRDGIEELLPSLVSYRDELAKGLE